MNIQGHTQSMERQFLGPWCWCHAAVRLCGRGSGPLAEPPGPLLWMQRSRGLRRSSARIPLSQLPLGFWPLARAVPPSLRG